MAVPWQEGSEQNLPLYFLVEPFSHFEFKIGTFFSNVCWHFNPVRVLKKQQVALRRPPPRLVQNFKLFKCYWNRVKIINTRRRRADFGFALSTFSYFTIIVWISICPGLKVPWCDKLVSEWRQEFCGAAVRPTPTPRPPSPDPITSALEVRIISKPS